MAGPILYVAEVDYGPESHAVFEAWYANRHAPDLFRFGAHTVSSYRPKVGGLAVFNVYQVDDSDAFKTERYKSINARDAYGPDVRATSAGKKRFQTLYLEHGATGEHVDADWIAVARFDLPESRDSEAAGWVKGEAQKLLAPLGLKRLRYGTRIADQVGAGSDRPRCILFSEWAAEPPALGEFVEKRFQAKDLLPFIGRRRYPWPDKKQ